MLYAYDAMAFSQSSTALMTLFNAHFNKFCHVPGTKHAQKKIDIHLIAIKVHMFRWKGAVLANP